MGRHLIACAFLVLGLSALLAVPASACGARHFYNNSYVTWHITVPDGSCGGGSNTTCSIPPHSTTELSYSGATKNIQVSADGNLFPQRTFNWAADAGYSDCHLDSNGNTGPVSLNEPANGDFTTCSDCGIGPIQLDFTPCAAENGSCKVEGLNGPVTVRFGTSAQYYYKTLLPADGIIQCSAAAFGAPAGGVHRDCDIGPGAFVHCAIEHGKCTFAKPSTVNYFIQATAVTFYNDFASASSIDCDNSTLANAVQSDPASCGVSSSPYVSSFMNEGEIRAFASGLDVVYGANGSYLYAHFNGSGSVACNNQTFGSDPIFGVPKRCLTKRPVVFVTPGHH